VHLLEHIKIVNFTCLFIVICLVRHKRFIGIFTEPADCLKDTVCPTVAGEVVSLSGRESKNLKIHPVCFHPQSVLLASRQQVLRTGTEKRLQIVVLAACVTEVSEKLPLYHGAGSQTNRNCGRAICEGIYIFLPLMLINVG
jgi:hypothetical protein